MSYPNYKYGTGLSNVGSYQVSGKPFVSGGLDATSGEALKITFPSVTRWIYVINHDNGSGAHVKMGFSENGLEGDNWFRIGPQTATETHFSQRLELKVTEIYFTGSSDFDLVAGLTGISPDRITNISPSGSNWSGSLGVG